MTAGLVTVDVRKAVVLLALRNGAKRMTYSVANAINTTAKSIQRHQREHTGQQFVVRKEFTRRQASIIKPFASPAKGIMHARLSVGQPDRFLLGGFEQGAERRPFTPGAKRVGVPVIGGARPSKAASVDPQLTFQRLAIRPKPGRGRGRRRSSGRAPLVGRLGTFIARTARQPEGGVFQRTGPGRGDVRLLYAFVAHPPRLDRRLRFIPIAEDVTRREFPRHLGDEIRKTFAFQAARAALG